MERIVATEIYVPLMETEYENHFSKLDAVIDELCELSGKRNVAFPEQKQVALTIQKLSPENVKKVLNRKKALKHSSYFIKFSTTYKLNDKNDLNTYWIIAPILTEEHVKYLLIYLNIAKPGAIDSRGGVIVRTLQTGNKKKIKTGEFPMLANVIHLSLDLLTDYKWPPVKELNIIDALDWLDKHWDAFTTTPKNRIQRALNAFSYLFHDSLTDSSPSDLFFSLLGIEALYVDGNENIQKQVDIKSQILLGKRTEFKKKFNELYGFRSRYIHGQLNLVNKYYSGDAEPDVQDHVYKTFDNSHLAILILIASIQGHMLLNKDELEFEFKLKD